MSFDLAFFFRNLFEDVDVMPKNATRSRDNGRADFDTWNRNIGRILSNMEETTRATSAAATATNTYDSYDQVYYPIIGIFFVVGVLGNLLVIVLTIRDKELHSPTFAVIASLACADMMFLMIRIPLEFVFEFENDWVFGDVICRLYMYLLQCVAYAEAYHLVLLAIVRYYQLTHPLEALRNLTTARALCLSIALWLFIFVVLSPILAFTGEIHYRRGPADTKGVKVCYLKTKSIDAQEAYFVCYSVLCFFLPLSFLIVFHVGKAIKLRRGNRFAKANKNLKVMSVAVVCILVLFGVLLAPVHINNLLTITRTSTADAVTRIVIKLMAYLNSVMNPLVYALCAQKVRQSCLKCLPCSQFAR